MLQKLKIYIKKINHNVTELLHVLKYNQKIIIIYAYKYDLR